MSFFNKPQIYKKKDRTEDFKTIDLKEQIPMTSPKGLLRRLKISKNPDKLLDVTMYLRNGEKTQFIAVMDDDRPSFTYQDSTYIVDEKALMYNLGSKMYSAVYHQDIAIPFIQTIPVSKVKDAIEEAGVTDIDNAIDPHSLKRFMESNIIQNAMQGVEMMKILNFMKTLLLLILVIVAVLLLKYLGDSGAFSSLTGG